MIHEISVIISLGMMFILPSCSESGRNKLQDPPPVPVTIYKVEPEKVVYYDSYPCTLTALKEVGLRGEVTGYITDIFFTEGSRVSKGQKLYEIDRRLYEAAFKEANENLKIAHANLEKVQRDVDRYSALNKQEAIARQRYDYALTDLANAKSQVSVATEEQEKAKTNLEYSLITAPFDGTIGISQVKMGDLISPGQTLLNTISSDDPMGVDFVIDQTELNRFSKLKAMKPASGDSIFRLMLPDNSLFSSNGTIGIIDRAVDPQTGTIKIRLLFANRDHNLRPGMDCEVRVIHESEGLQFKIPFKAVLEQMGEYFVFLASANKVNEVKVVLGPRVGDGVIIQDGLKQGDVIVADGIGKLVDGTSINIEPPQGKVNYSLKY
ncbi:MAG: efflux RND transporter periplasmic adaptor subunit [Bacteroidales bacterium]|jgi:membrane fusion protein (multidrug efflux system)|nr:efflux RND transporter periplasmic adaptor subunit [Bacteroidales bacterium]